MVFGALRRGVEEDLTSSIYEFDPDTLSWRTVKNASPSSATPLARKHYGICSINKHVIIHGGTTGPGLPLVDLRCFNTQTHLWSSPASSTILMEEEMAEVPCARSLHTASVSQGCVYVYGGFDPDNSQQAIFGCVRCHILPRHMVQNHNRTDVDVHMRSSLKKFDRMIALLSSHGSGYFDSDVVCEEEIKILCSTIQAYIRDVKEKEVTQKEWADSIKVMNVGKVTLNVGGTVYYTSVPTLTGEVLRAKVLSHSLGGIPEDRVVGTTPRPIPPVTSTLGTSYDSNLSLSLDGDDDESLDPSTASDIRLSHRRSSIESDIDAIMLGGPPSGMTDLVPAEFVNEDHMLKAMFSGSWEAHLDDQDMYFIDRDGAHFGLILNYLRDGRVLLSGEREAKELILEANFFQLRGLVHLVETYLHSIGN